ncbi:hypothetical protein MOR33_004028 [Salmonella enterica]|nr:hypothetical protein [Salmonella enterica]
MSGKRKGRTWRPVEFLLLHLLQQTFSPPACRHWHLTSPATSFNMSRLKWGGPLTGPAM